MTMMHSNTADLFTKSHKDTRMDTYLASSNFSSSLFAFDATKFTADDTLLSTALLLSNFPLSFSIDIGVDVASDDVVVVVVVAAPVVDAKDDEFEFK